MKQLAVAIVGATGAVGQEMRRVLESRDFPVASLKLLASERSAGKRLTWRRSGIPVEALSAAAFAGVDLVLFSAGAAISREFVPLAVGAGAVVVDNSSAFRLEPDVPLVIPEVNPQDIDWHHGIIANPNCSTIQMVVVLKPLHDRFRIKRVVVSTYQAVSGTGLKAVDELLAQSRLVLEGESAKPQIYPHQIAFNLLPHIDVFFESGYTKEEVKMIEESRKIMGMPELRITTTTVRVPVVTGHAESVNVEFEEPVTPALARELLGEAPGVEVIDDPLANAYPMPITAVGKDSCFVGRIRRDESVASGLNLWIVSDNLRKGAALNAVQIAELLVSKGALAHSERSVAQ